MTDATPLGVSRADLDEVERLVRGAGTSFYRGMRVLPADRRVAMYAIYAFCRVVDDIADEAGAWDDKLAGLAAWRARIDALYQGQTEDAVTRALHAAVERFDLRRQDFIDIIDGMQTDAEHEVVAPSLEELDLYCDRVASAVGRLSVRCFGDSSAAADEVAHALGRALQLTNVLRDLQEDAERGRLYLPREYLDAEGVPPRPLPALESPHLAAVCRRVAALAHQHFDRATAAMDRCDRRAMRPARLMRDTYAAILRRLEQSGWQHPAERVSLPLWQKLAIAARHVVL
jgi:presqualene diphosphate synthase